MPSATRKYPPNFLRQWRDFRKLSQADLGARIGTTGPVIHLLENQERSLSHKWLVKLAAALETSPGFLLDHDPYDLPSDILEIWNRAAPEQRRQIVSVAEALVPYRHEEKSA